MRAAKVLLAVTVFAVMITTGHGIVSAVIATLVALLTYVIIKRALKILWFIVTFGRGGRQARA